MVSRFICSPFTPTLSAADFYQSKIDELEDDHRDHFLTTDELIDILEKMVMRLARSNDKSIAGGEELISELREKNDELEIYVKDKFLMSQRIDQLSEKPRFEETILRTELLAKKMQISELSEELDKCKIEIKKQNITISGLNKQNKQNSDISDTLTTEYETLKRKVCWLNLAINNVKDKYSDCRNILVMRDNAIRTLSRSLHLTRQRCEDILLESRQREYRLAETRVEIEQLRESLKSNGNTRIMMSRKVVLPAMITCSLCIKMLYKNF